MSEHKDTTKLQDKILQSIKTGDIKMRPRWHFVLKSVMLLVGILLSLLVLLYIISFIIFTLHENGLWFAPIFGLPVLRTFLLSLPWLLILISLIFIVLLEILVRKYSFGFRKPLLYTALAIVAVSLIGGMVIAETPFHSHFSRGLYGRVGTQHFKDIHICTVTEVTQGGFRCIDTQKQTLSVLIISTTRLPLGNDFVLGDKVLVFGEENGDSITALGVRKIEKTKIRPLVSRADF